MGPSVECCSRWFALLVRARIVRVPTLSPRRPTAIVRGWSRRPHPSEDGALPPPRFFHLSHPLDLSQFRPLAAPNSVVSQERSDSFDSRRGCAISYRPPDALVSPHTKRGCTFWNCSDGIPTIAGSSSKDVHIRKNKLYWKL